MWCGGEDERKKKRNHTLEEGELESTAIGRAAYQMIGPGMTNLMVLFDNQQLGDKTDRKRTSWGFKM